MTFLLGQVMNFYIDPGVYKIRFLHTISSLRELEKWFFLSLSKMTKIIFCMSSRLSNKCFDAYYI